MRNHPFDRSGFSRTMLLTMSTLAVCVFLFFKCTLEHTEEPAEYRTSTAVALDWNRLALELERKTTGYRPPVSARMFAYVELAAYEAALPGMEGYVSLEEFIAGFERPAFHLSSGQFYLPASLNASYAGILRHFFANAPGPLKDEIDRLETRYHNSFSSKSEAQKIAQSRSWGQSVAEQVWQWSKTDQTGHLADLNNYNPDYTAPGCAGCWQPTDHSMRKALLPAWGNTRPFIVKPEKIIVRDPVLFSEVPGSAFYTGALEVFSVSQPLSRENHWIAELWSDDLPGLTVSPAGRWISITIQALEKAKPAFPDVMETFVKCGLALCDSGISVWKAKYKYNVERPVTYINRVIQGGWSPLHDTPPFPAYPSGHSAFGSAVAAVLSAQLGEHFELEDRTHENRQEFAGQSRSYHSFVEMAEENAASRVLMGVHYRMDCEEGLRIGKLIGQKIAGLPLKQKETALTERR